MKPDLKELLAQAERLCLAVGLCAERRRTLDGMIIGRLAEWEKRQQKPKPELKPEDADR